jgi:hypothetical protein
VQPGVEKGNGFFAFRGRRGELDSYGESERTAYPVKQRHLEGVGGESRAILNSVVATILKPGGIPAVSGAPFLVGKSRKWKFFGRDYGDGIKDLDRLRSTGNTSDWHDQTARRNDPQLRNREV